MAARSLPSGLPNVGMRNLNVLGANAPPDSNGVNIGNVGNDNDCQQAAPGICG